MLTGCGTPGLRSSVPRTCTRTCRDPEPGQIADYTGTGGSICDIDIVRDSSFFTELPRRFAFLEDQWACGYAKSRGWAVRKADVDITFVLHETNQFLNYADLKNEFRVYLLALPATSAL